MQECFSQTSCQRYSKLKATQCPHILIFELMFYQLIYEVLFRFQYVAFNRSCCHSIAIKATNFMWNFLSSLFVLFVSKTSHVMCTIWWDVQNKKTSNQNTWAHASCWEGDKTKKGFCNSLCLWLDFDFDLLLKLYQRWVNWRNFSLSLFKTKTKLNHRHKPLQKPIFVSSPF